MRGCGTWSLGFQVEARHFHIDDVVSFKLAIVDASSVGFDATVFNVAYRESNWFAVECFDVHQFCSVARQDETNVIIEVTYEWAVRVMNPSDLFGTFYLYRRVEGREFDFWTRRAFEAKGYTFAF